MIRRLFFWVLAINALILPAKGQTGNESQSFGRADIRTDTLEGEFLREMRPDEARFMGIVMRVILNEGQKSGRFARFQSTFPQLVNATREAFDRQDNRLAYLLSCRVALLYNGFDINEGVDVATAYQFRLSARLVDPPQSLVLNLEPLFCRKQALEKGRYKARFTLLDKNQGDKELPLGELEISEMKNYALEINTSGWDEGEYAIRYDLFAPDGTVLIDGLQRRFQIVPGLSTQLDHLGRQWEKLENDPPSGIPAYHLSIVKHTADYILGVIREAQQSYTGGTHQTGYPMVQRIRRQEESRRQPMAFRDELAQLQQMITLLQEGRDPFREMKGELCLAYRPEGKSRAEPFRVYLPESLDWGKSRNLVIGLHGAGGDEQSFMRHYVHPQTGMNFLKAAMAQRAYILASPRGGGSYSYYEGDASEDVVEVTRILQELYQVDPASTFLMGHSMGGGGTIKIGLRHPELYAALAPVAGGANDIQMDTPLSEKALQMPVLFSQGLRDIVVTPQASRRGARILSDRLTNFKYREYEEAGHEDIVYYALPDILAFFDDVQKKKKP